MPDFAEVVFGDLEGRRIVNREDNNVGVHIQCLKQFLQRKYLIIYIVMSVYLFRSKVACHCSRLWRSTAAYDKLYLSTTSLYMSRSATDFFFL